MRNNAWLEKQLDFLLKKYFVNVKLTNPIEIKFGREAKYRFGSIKLYRGARRNKRARRARGQIENLKFKIKNLKNRVPQKSIITITSMFARESVPAGVVRYTICHELCHYAHGFSSTNKRLFKHPHHGGIVNKELRERQAEDLILVFKKWLK